MNINLLKLFILLNSLPSLAIIPVRDLNEPTIPFYKLPDSSFPSGIEGLSKLQRSKLQSKSELWYLIDDLGKMKWAPANTLRFFNKDEPTSLQYQKGYVSETTPSLRLNHGWRASGEINAGKKITITSIRSDWSCGLDHESKPICVNSNKVILPIDTTTKVQTIRGQWYKIKARKNNFFQTINNTYIPIHKVKEWVPDYNIGFLQETTVTKSHPLQYISRKSEVIKKVLIKDKELKTWHQSQLDNHGNIWWQEIKDIEKNRNHSFITNHELISRGLFSKATSKKSLKKISIASANGIFLSKDDETWYFLDQFGEENLPVAIGPRNTLIVGDQISFDEGKTFQNYLRWDQIAYKVQTHLRHSPKHLRLLRVSQKESNILDVEIDIGYKILSFDFNTINNFISLRTSRLVNNK